MSETRPVDPDAAEPGRPQVFYLGDGSALDKLAHRDYVFGLELELAEAHIEIDRLTRELAAIRARKSSRALHAAEQAARGLKRRLGS